MWQGGAECWVWLLARGSGHSQLETGLVFCCWCLPGVRWERVPSSSRPGEAAAPPAYVSSGTLPLSSAPGALEQGAGMGAGMGRAVTPCPGSPGALEGTRRSRDPALFPPLDGLIPAWGSAAPWRGCPGTTSHGTTSHGTTSQPPRPLLLGPQHPQGPRLGEQLQTQLRTLFPRRWVSTARLRPGFGTSCSAPSGLFKSL